MLILDKSPTIAAQSLDNLNLIKTMYDVQKVLYSVATLRKIPGYNQKPVKGYTKWANATLSNYFWMVKYWVQLAIEYQFRFKRQMHVIEMHKLFLQVSKTGIPTTLKESKLPINISDHRKRFLKQALKNKSPYKWRFRKPPKWYIEYKGDENVIK